MIVDFADKATADIFHGTDSREARAIPRDIWPVARCKLDALNGAHVLNDLRVPPANRLEKLKGVLAGRFRIRINKQFRVIFRFEDGRASEVKVTDDDR